MEKIKREIAVVSAKKNFSRLKYGDKSASQFWRDLQEQIKEGWSDFGQTNEILRIIGTIGRIFRGLSGEELKAFIVEKAKSLPGYRHYCRHQHNIHQRAKDWGRCIEKYYYPYGSNPNRADTFKDMVKKGRKENTVNGNRQKEAKIRIEQAVSHIFHTVQKFPQKVGEMKTLLLETLNKLFSIRPSDKTLRKYVGLWHPQYISGDDAIAEELCGHPETANGHSTARDITPEPSSPQSSEAHHLENDPQQEEEPSPEQTKATEEDKPQSQPITIETGAPSEEDSQAREPEEKTPEAIAGKDLSSRPHPPLKKGKKSKSQKRARPASAKRSKEKSPTPLYKKVRKWKSRKVVLTYEGKGSWDLIDYDVFDENGKKEYTEKSQLRSIYPNQEVLLVNCDHSSMWFHPEDEENLQVYVTPLSELSSWHLGVAVKAKDLREKIENKSASNEDVDSKPKPPT